MRGVEVGDEGVIGFLLPHLHQPVDGLPGLLLVSRKGLGDACLTKLEGKGCAIDPFGDGPEERDQQASDQEDLVFMQGSCAGCPCHRGYCSAGVFHPLNDEPLVCPPLFRGEHQSLVRGPGTLGRSMSPVVER